MRDERKQFIHVPFDEVKFASGDAVALRKFSGYGAFFKNVDSYGDVIEPGAFSQNLSDIKGGKAAWPLMLSQHGGWGMTADDMTPVGVWTELSEDGHGLKVEGKLADTARGEDLYKLMKMDPRPAITGLSIGYIAREFEQGAKPSDPKRRLKRIDVMEISLVSFPANPKARIGTVKSIEAIASLRDAEEFLRAGGMPQSMAVALVSKIKAVRPSDSEEGEGGPGDPAAEAAQLRALFKARGVAQPHP